MNCNTCVIRCEHLGLVDRLRITLALRKPQLGPGCQMLVAGKCAATRLPKCCQYWQAFAARRINEQVRAVNALQEQNAQLKRRCRQFAFAPNTESKEGEQRK